MPAGGTVLEVGSGPGWDADLLEAHGVAVRRTDLTRAFIDLQAARGKVVERLDVTTDELGGPYDAVLALAVLQHVERPQLPGRRSAASPRRSPRAAPSSSRCARATASSGRSATPATPTSPCCGASPTSATCSRTPASALDWRSAAEDAEESPWLTFLARRGR